MACIRLITGVGAGAPTQAWASSAMLLKAQRYEHITPQVKPNIHFILVICVHIHIPAPPAQQHQATTSPQQHLLAAPPILPSAKVKAFVSGTIVLYATAQCVPQQGLRDRSCCAPVAWPRLDPPPRACCHPERALSLLMFCDPTQLPALLSLFRTSAPVDPVHSIHANPPMGCTPLLHPLPTDSRWHPRS